MRLAAIFPSSLPIDVSSLSRHAAPRLALNFVSRFPTVQNHAAAKPLQRLAHGPSSFAGAQLVEQRLGVLQIACVESLGEPAVDFGERRARLVATTLLCEKPREARRRAQFPGLRVLVERNVDRGAKGLLRSRGVRRVLASNRSPFSLCTSASYIRCPLRSMSGNASSMVRRTSSNRPVRPRAVAIRARW